MYFLPFFKNPLHNLYDTPALNQTVMLQLHAHSHSSSYPHSGFYASLIATQYFQILRTVKREEENSNISETN